MANQFFGLFQRSGIGANLITEIPSGPEEEGLVIEVKDKSKIPEPIKQLLNVLEMTGVHATVKDAKNPSSIANDNYFVLFVAPAHVD